MQFFSTNKAARPQTRTVLGVESLGDRVMPSVGVSLPAAPPAEAAEVRIDTPVQVSSHIAKIDFSGNHVSNMGGLSGGVIASGHSPVSTMGGLSGGVIASGGVVIEGITRSSGEEIPQTL